MSIARTSTGRKLVVVPEQKPEGKLSAVPDEIEARGFALYLGIDETTAKAAGTSLSEIANALRKTFAELVPGAEDQTYAAVALAPKGTGGKNIDVVRSALRDPRAIEQFIKPADDENSGIKVDLSRHRVYVNGENAEFTAKEFELLAHLIENEGETISREELVDVISGDGESANDRTIDVHVRRLRAKIAGFEDIVRTVRGGGYRFDRHPDVFVDDYQI